MESIPPPWPGAEGASTPRQSGAEEPPPPTGPAYPGAAPTGAPGPVGPVGTPVRKRRGAGPWIAAVLAVALLGIAVVVGDWYARTLEMDRLVAGIESSEAAMIEGMDQVRVALREDGVADGIAPETGEELQQIADAAAAGVAAAATQIGDVVVQPWHEDVLAAREVYLAHNAAWQAFLAAAAEEPEQWFAQDESIETTWNAVGPALRTAVPTPALRDLDQRVAQILDDTGESEDGPALDAAA